MGFAASEKQRRLMFFLGYCVSVAAYITFSDFHRFVNADTIVTYLVSLLKWTPFFWGQDRFGMIWPLVALPVSDATANALLQSFLHLSAFFAVFFLWARFLFGTERWLSIGLLSGLLFLGLATQQEIQEYLGNYQIYSNALFFGLLALLLPNRWLILALGLSVIAHWCNFFVGPFLLLIILLRQVFDRRWGWRPFVILGFGTIVGHVIRQPYATSESAGYLFGSNPFGGFSLLENQVMSGAPLLAGPLILAGITAVTFRGQIRTVWKPYRNVYLAAVVGPLIYIFLIGATQLAEWTGYPTRYLIPCILLWIPLHAGLALLVVSSRWLNGLLVAATFFILLFRFGWPSLSAAESALDAALAPIGREPLRLRCTHVAGNYYRIWPSVYYARRNGVVMWGVGNRSMETRPDYSLKNFSNPRICIWKDDLEDARRAMNYDSLKVIEESAVMYVFSLPSL